jgi:hypothetical protein
MADQSTSAIFNYGDRDAPQEFPVRHTKVQVTVLDGRCSGKVCKASDLAEQLDTAGFSLVIDAPVVSSGLVQKGEDLQDSTVVDATYMDFHCEYFRRALGCHRVVPINHVYRKSGRESALPTGFNQTVPKVKGGTTGAIANVHADSSVDAPLVEKFRQVVEDDDETRGGRFTLLNCWRPLTTVHRWPLAVCDATSVNDEEDLYSRATPENSNVVANSFPERAAEGKHKWYFWPAQTPEEMIVFKQWEEDAAMRQESHAVADGKLPGVARQTLHSAFNLPAPPDAPVRWSLEARFACIWKPGPKSVL